MGCKGGMGRGKCSDCLLLAFMMALIAAWQMFGRQVCIWGMGGAMGRRGEALSDMQYKHFISLLLVLFNYAVINFATHRHTHFCKNGQKLTCLNVIIVGASNKEPRRTKDTNVVLQGQYVVAPPLPHFSIPLFLALFTTTSPCPSLSHSYFVQSGSADI